MKCRIQCILHSIAQKRRPIHGVRRSLIRAHGVMHDNNPVQSYGHSRMRWAIRLSEFLKGISPSTLTAAETRAERVMDPGEAK
jgi:hypothetical protein